MSYALIGTAKGLVVLDLDGPKLEAIYFKGFSITMLHIDSRDQRWWVGISHKHWGQKLHYSEDFGNTWHETPTPVFEDATMPDGSRARVRQLWCMANANTDKPGNIWVGTDPGALFESDDNGKSFQLVTGLWNHPSRNNPGQWFGAGSDHPFIHSIVVDPLNSDHVYIAISCAGVFETTDGGKSWEARNSGLVAAYLPNPHVEIGHDPHLLLQHPVDRNVLWQQNHCGIYVSRDSGASWNDVSGKDGMPYYGFAIAIDDEDPARAWVIPVESDEQRVAPELQLKVYQTSDYGSSWQEMNDGLPEPPVFDIVLRHAFAKNGRNMLFGTTNGNLYFSDSGSPEWKLIMANLTKVNTVKIGIK
ncbi:WD40/YVTN/BNR-like repeat-containing protein [Fulvivirga sedimenti]|uniref:Glycosyl hydrolase n=1 Tax=Fulvivirga sedimenti TaxID=2879465 RepID=A0A9X1KV98_9BACT|nr:glycosyl hydrolase [Fulvivirga sedimenti]MCA6074508.1 glycosyl hydrolase [Fulvivirga sedimenti]MCA6075685.1 glycosyl hydrolase [Fulvivirga sedimenti]MCA6076813.1 glycosyl hydrolase [Fulvivirga sedimenti]